MNRGEINSLEAAEANLCEQKNRVEAAEQAIKDAYREAHEAKEDYEAAKFQVEAIKRKNHIEEIFWRFPHIGEQILGELDEESVANCQEVSRRWQKFMDESKVVWIWQIQKYISISNSTIRKTLLKQSWNYLKELTHLLHLLFIRSQNDPKELTVTNPMLLELICNENEDNCTFLIKLIIDNLNDKNPVIIKGKSLLQITAITGNLEVCKIVANNLENKNPADNNGDTILHIAATCGSVEIYQFILEKITKDNPRNILGSTPFHVAAKNGHLEICSLIIANMDARNIKNFDPTDNDGKTPFQVAKEHGHEEICELIKSASDKWKI